MLTHISTDALIRRSDTCMRVITNIDTKPHIWNAAIRIYWQLQNELDLRQEGAEPNACARAL